MIITVDISMYPLDAEYKPPIKAFIRDLRGYPDIDLVTNQLSTQLRGEYVAVTEALNECMARAMQADSRVVFVVRYLNADLDIRHFPDIS